jgi:predicted HTH domain antitoxin
MSDFTHDKKQADTLTLFHHQHDFEVRIHHLLTVMDYPKEHELIIRFKQIVALINDEFYHDLVQHNLISREEVNPPSRLLLLLHINCFLACTDSFEAIANFLNLSLNEVIELVRECRSHFSIETLKSRIRAYYESRKKHLEEPLLALKNELLGDMVAHEPKDITENRRLRLRRKYGHADKLMDIPEGPI